MRVSLFSPLLTAILVLFLGSPHANAQENLGPNTSLLSVQKTPDTTPASSHAVQKQLLSILSGSKLRTGTTSIYVMDAKSGEEIYSQEAQVLLNPASNVKLISTATVLSTLGPDWRYQTRLIGSAPNQEGKVESGIYLQGNYDPTLGPGALSDIAKSLKSQGVRSIAGDIVLSDDPLKDTLAAAHVQIRVLGKSGGRRPTLGLWPHTNLVKIDTSGLKSRRRGKSRVKATWAIKAQGDAPAQLHVILSGNIRPGRSKMISVPIPSRPDFSADVLRLALEKQGITVEGQSHFAPIDQFNKELSAHSLRPTSLASHHSAPISDLIKRVNKRSLNHLADRLVMSAASEVYGNAPSMEDATALMYKWLDGIGIDSQKIVIDTGSGLSYETQLSTKQIAKVLQAAGGYLKYTQSSDIQSSDTYQEVFRDSLAIAAKDGTLRSRFRQKGLTLRNTMMGKTGTLTNIIALSGYLTNEQGRTLCFSIVTNDHPSDYRGAVRKEHERLVNSLDSYLRSSRHRKHQKVKGHTPIIANSRTPASSFR